jgi:ParB-like chromosome segregation protein Spo0J
MHFLPARQVCGDHPISLEMLPLSSIKGNPNNAREHNQKQLAKLARSIEKFGFITPIRRNW